MEANNKQNIINRTFFILFISFILNKRQTHIFTWYWIYNYPVLVKQLAISHRVFQAKQQTDMRPRQKMSLVMGEEISIQLLNIFHVW
jgi:hypothetical protein